MGEKIMKKYRIKAFIILLCLNANMLLSYNEIYIDKNHNTALKVSTATCKVQDIFSDRIPSNYELKMNPGYVKQSNDSTYLKALTGITIDSSFITRLDDSFYKLKANDSIEFITIYPTKFDYEHLVNSLVENNIALGSLSLFYFSKDYPFPKDIYKIRELKELLLAFGNMIPNLDSNIYNMKSIRKLTFCRCYRYINTEYLSNMKNLKELVILGSDSIDITEEFSKNTNLEDINIQETNLLNNSFQNISNLNKLRYLTIMECNLNDGQLNLEELRNLIFLNLEDNNLSRFPKEVLYLDNLKHLVLWGNKIKNIPFDLMLSLPKRKNVLKIGIDIDSNSLADKDRVFLQANKELLKEKGYIFDCSIEGVPEDTYHNK
jgi:Leucine-rich repeat (LRR) protein